uniref:Uncharacterized protein n=1 Tax=Ciona savignyi TaxID=51511 RepID=H2Z429_CIOSA
MINVTINELDNSLNDTGDSVNLTMSFIIMQPGNYSEEEILELTEALYEVINFQEMIIEDDVFIISVVESRHAVLLECEVDSIKVMYNSSEYITTIYNGASIIYVNKSESYYMQGEYQLLDWSITVTEDTVIYSSIKESRVVVCDSLTQPPPPPTACRIYLPLNQSEYVILNNGSLWMDARGLMVGEDGYIDYGDAVAVCIDDYVPPEQPNTTSVATEPEMDPVVDIINWVTFGLTLFSLLSLCVTFITYVLFSELRTVAGRNLMNLTVALFVSQLMFMVGSSMIDPPSLCTAFTLILHYLFLSTF